MLSARLRVDEMLSKCCKSFQMKGGIFDTYLVLAQLKMSYIGQINFHEKNSIAIALL